MYDIITISVAQAAKMLGVSKPVIYQLARREDFPAFRIGKRLLIDADGLRNWAHQQSRKEGTV